MGYVNFNGGTFKTRASNLQIFGTGATAVNAGTLKLAAGSAIPTASPIVVAAGATLEIANGQTNFVSITGGGNVTGSCTPAAFVADFANVGVETPAIPHVTGTVTLGTQVVSLANAPDPIVRSIIPIATATSFAGDVTGLTIEPGILPAKWRAKFSLATSGGVTTLKLKILPPKAGTLILFR